MMLLPQSQTFLPFDTPLFSLMTLAQLVPVAALENDAAREVVSGQLVGGYYSDGVYFYPITDPPDVYYMVIGPGYPCNPFNNNSDVRVRGRYSSQVFYFCSLLIRLALFYFFITLLSVWL